MGPRVLRKLRHKFLLNLTKGHTAPTNRANHIVTFLLPSLHLGDIIEDICKKATSDMQLAPKVDLKE